MTITGKRVILGYLAVLTFSHAQEKKEATLIEFRFSEKTAREYESHDGSEFVFAFGDAEGPFAYVGGIAADAPAIHHYRARMSQSIAGTTRNEEDPDLLYQVHFFVNKAGNGFGVVRKKSKKEEDQKTAELKAGYFPEKPEGRDERPSAHVALCEAAEFALYEGNIKLMESLLQAGYLINEVIDLESKSTALHWAALFNQPAMVKMLIENGANCEVENEWGNRPIDTAFEKEQWEVCDALKKPAGAEPMIGGFPSGLLQSLNLFDAPDPEEIRFLAINGADPERAVLDYFRKHWPNVRKASRKVEVSREEAGKAKSNSTFFDPDTKEFGSLVEISIKPNGDESYQWSNRHATGSFLSGGGVEGTVVKRYGYWIASFTSSWDE